MNYAMDGLIHGGRPRVVPMVNHGMMYSVVNHGFADGLVPEVCTGNVAQ